jgi:hypothetical protein
MIQAVGANGLLGNISQAGFEAYDSPTFVDGRQYLKQNLLFELRAATISLTNNPLAYEYYWEPDFYSIGIPADQNYVESSIFHWAIQLNDYFSTTPGYYRTYINSQANQYIEMDDLWPVEANYQLHGPLYDPNYSGPTTFNWQQNLRDEIDGFNYTFQGNLNTFPAPAVLGISDPYWIGQFSLTAPDPVTGLPVFRLIRHNSQTWALIPAVPPFICKRASTIYLG